MEGKLADWQNSMISETLAKLALETPLQDRLTEARRSLTEEFLALNAQTDFQTTPSEIPPGWLEQAKKASVAEVVEQFARRGFCC